MTKELAITVDRRRQTVRVVIVWRGRWGIHDRRQVTFPLAVFERAIRDADLVVPWREVAPHEH
jgi:hypothetical protein